MRGDRNSGHGDVGPNSTYPGAHFHWMADELAVATFIAGCVKVDYLLVERAA